MKKIKTVAAMVIVAVGLLAGSKSVYAAESTTVVAENNAEAFMTQINALRSSAGVQPLVLDASLNEAASVRAQECTVSFSHFRPDGSIYWTVGDDVMGENLALMPVATTYVSDTVTAWINSPSHYENIVFGSYRVAGIATVTVNGHVYVAMEFGY